MFRWLRGGGEDGIEKVGELFVQMLLDGRHVFDIAMSARVGGAAPETLQEDLFTTEERTDETEREIRRRILVHASVAGGADIPASLLYMSVVKDAERVADLSKNLFGIAETVGPPPPGTVRDDLVRLKDEVSPMIAEAARIFDEDDTEGAEQFLERARDIQEHCRSRINAILTGGVDTAQPAATALSYRHLGRICANLLNIVSAVVVPLDRLDYPQMEDDDRV